MTARPIHAAIASAVTFSVGAALPLLMVLVSPSQNRISFDSVASLIFLVLLGVITAKIGGANILKGALRVGFWGALAMAAPIHPAKKKRLSTRKPHNPPYGWTFRQATPS